MIKAVLTNDSLRYITEIEKNRYKVSEINLPGSAASRLRKNSKKKSSYASNRIEGNPPHPEIWINYFLRMVQIYSDKVCELSEESSNDAVTSSLSYLKGKEKELLLFLLTHYRREFTPIEISREFGVTNKTIINRLSTLVKNGFAEPVLAKERIRSYKLSSFSAEHEKELIAALKK